MSQTQHKKIIKKAKGFYGSKHKLFKSAKEQWMRSLHYAYRDRKQKKRNFRRLWITHLNNACRERGLTYSRFMRLITLAQIKLNRKRLSELAIHQPQHFTDLIDKVQNPW